MLSALLPSDLGRHPRGEPTRFEAAAIPPSIRPVTNEAELDRYLAVYSGAGEPDRGLVFERALRDLQSQLADWTTPGIRPAT